MMHRRGGGAGGLGTGGAGAPSRRRTYYTALTEMAERKKYLYIVLGCLLLLFVVSYYYVNGRGVGFNKGFALPSNPRVVNDTAPINIAVPYDKGSYNHGMKALINSVIKNASPTNRKRLCFYMITIPEDETECKNFVKDMQATHRGIKTKTTVFRKWEKVKHLYRPGADSRFGTPLNVARIYLEDLIPSNVDKVISLDADQVVNVDIVHLWNEADLIDPATAMASHTGPTALHLGHYLRWSDNPVVNVSDIDMSQQVFGGGLFVANLTTWRHDKLYAQIERWGLVSTGAPVIARALKKTLLNMVYNRRVLHLSDFWNGGNCFMERDESEKRAILHFAGMLGKPWQTNSSCTDGSRELWNEYYHWQTYPRDGVLGNFIG